MLRSGQVEHGSDRTARRRANVLLTLKLRSGETTKDAKEGCFVCFVVISYLRVAEIFQIRFEASSETSSEPSRATSTPTGRPHRRMSVPSAPVLVRNPVRKSSIGPGFPLFIGKNTTL